MSAKSRVFRQVVTMEIIALVAPDVEDTHFDGEQIVRDAIQEHAGGGGVWLVAGEGNATAIGELMEVPF